jgi:hypothetical protein
VEKERHKRRTVNSIPLVNANAVGSEFVCNERCVPNASVSLEDRNTRTETNSSEHVKKKKVMTFTFVMTWECVSRCLFRLIA